MKKNRKGFYQGIYIVENKEKYKGKNNPICRSSWEHRFSFFLDHHPDVKMWCFECLVIPYYNRIDNRMHRYITDFCFVETDSEENTKKFVVEIKPKKQILPPTPPKNKNKKAQKRYICEAHTYAKNRFKWEAADKYCKEKGYEFRIVCLVGENWEVYSINDIV